MKSWLRYGLAAIVGLAVGVGGAAQVVRIGAFGSGQQIGPWRTGTDYGTAEASARTRAIVALSGLLALPAREARYYTAVADDSGAPLDGKCSYTVSGGELPGRWWSLTLYDAGGYLVGNDPNIFSVPSAALAPTERDNWTIHVAPTRTEGHWLPSGGAGKFQLTLRAYRPPDEGRNTPPRDALPRITKGACA